MDCFIVRRGGANVRKANDLMPHTDGIMGYFDISSVDLANNKWGNRISGGNDMDIINGGEIDSNALFLTSEQYGEFQMATEPNTIYCVFKVITPTNQWKPIAGKKTTTTTASYALELSCSTSNNISVVLQGSEIYSSVLALDYHVACISRYNGTAALYIDGTKIGSNKSYTGNYGGSCYINRYYRSGFMHTPTDVKFKMCAFGYEPHDETAVSENSEFLMKLIE